MIVLWVCIGANLLLLSACYGDLNSFGRIQNMIYRAFVGGKKVTTSNLNDLDGCEDVDVFIPGTAYTHGLWIIYR